MRRGNLKAPNETERAKTKHTTAISTGLVEATPTISGAATSDHYFYCKCCV